MATTHFSWAFPATAARLIGDYSCLEDVGCVLEDAPQATLLMSASRNGWLLGTLVSVCTELGLARLKVFKQTYSSFSVMELPEVLQEIEYVLAFARDCPELISDVMHHDYDAESVSLGLQASVEAAVPHLGPSRGEEGDDPEYLFSWLKSLRMLVLQANESGLCLVHVQPRCQA